MIDWTHPIVHRRFKTPKRSLLFLSFFLFYNPYMFMALFVILEKLKNASTKWKALCENEHKSQTLLNARNNSAFYGLIAFYFVDCFPIKSWPVVRYPTLYMA